MITNTLIARPLPGAAAPGHASVHGRTVGSAPGPSAGRSGVKPGTRKTVAHRYPPGWNENGFRAATPRRPASAEDRHSEARPSARAQGLVEVLITPGDRSPARNALGCGGVRTWPNRFRASGARASNSSQAAARARGRAAGPPGPSPDDRGRVTHVGRHAWDAAGHGLADGQGKASSTDDDVARSRPAGRRGMSRRGPSRWQRPRRPYAATIETSVGVPFIHPVPHRRKWTSGKRLLEDRNGAEEVQRVLRVAYRATRPDQHGVRSEAELPAHLERRRRVGAKDVGVEPVGDDYQPLGRVAPPFVLRRRADWSSRRSGWAADLDSRAHDSRRPQGGTLLGLGIVLGLDVIE